MVWTCNVVLFQKRMENKNKKGIQSPQFCGLFQFISLDSEFHGEIQSFTYVPPQSATVEGAILMNNPYTFFWLGR